MTRHFSCCQARCRRTGGACRLRRGGGALNRRVLRSPPGSSRPRAVVQEHEPCTPPQPRKRRSESEDGVVEGPSDDARARAEMAQDALDRWGIFGGENKSTLVSPLPSLPPPPLPSTPALPVPEGYPRGTASLPSHLSKPSLSVTRVGRRTPTRRAAWTAPPWRRRRRRPTLMRSPSSGASTSSAPSCGYSQSRSSPRASFCRFWR